MPMQQHNDEFDAQDLSVATSWWQHPKPYPIGLKSCENEPPVLNTYVPEGVVTASEKGCSALPAEGRAELARQQALAKLPPQPLLGTRLVPGLNLRDMPDADSLEAPCGNALSEPMATAMQSPGEPPTALPIPFKDDWPSPLQKAEWPAELARDRALHALTQAQA